MRQAADALLAAAELPRERPKGDSTVAYDLRPFLGALDVGSEAPDGSTIVRMTLRHDPERGVGRPDEALAALGEALGGPALVPAALVRESIVLADPPSPPNRRHFAASDAARSCARSAAIGRASQGAAPADTGGGPR